MSTAVKVGASNAPRVVVGRLERVRRGKRTAFEVAVPRSAAEPQPAGVALTLALAHAVQRAIDSGASRDQAEAARKLGMTRARVTQLLDLTMLDPTVQEKVLAAVETSPGGFTERGLRRACFHESWRLQAEALAGLFGL